MSQMLSNVLVFALGAGLGSIATILVLGILFSINEKKEKNIKIKE